MSDVSKIDCFKKSYIKGNVTMIEISRMSKGDVSFGTASNNEFVEKSWSGVGV